MGVDRTEPAQPTRWWWVRHAPVREDNGRIYGQKDLGCDTSDGVVNPGFGEISVQ